MDKKKRIRIIVPVCIILLVAGIWSFKNVEKGILPDKEADFALEAVAVDLESLTAYGLPIIIDFGSDSCIPCRQMAPVLETIHEEMRGRAIVKFVDVWKHTDAARGFPVQLIPTQVFIRADGTPYVPSEGMEIEFTMYDASDSGEHAFTTHQGALSAEQMRSILADMGVVSE
jgi:thioredoxin 1